MQIDAYDYDSVVLAPILPAIPGVGGAQTQIHSCLGSTKNLFRVRRAEWGVRRVRIRPGLAKAQLKLLYLRHSMFTKLNQLQADKVVLVGEVEDVLFLIDQRQPSHLILICALFLLSLSLSEFATLYLFAHTSHNLSSHFRDLIREKEAR